MKFWPHLINTLLVNNGDSVSNLFRSIPITDKIVLAQGYGASSRVPIRFLAYAVPVLRLAYQLPKSSVIEFYFAGHGVARANGAYYEKSINLMQEKLLQYIELFHPTLVPRVKILEDTPMSKDLEEAVEHLTILAQEVLNRDSQLRSFVVNRSGEKSLRYMVEHMLYMRDPFLFEGEIFRKTLVPKMETNFDHLVMIGGPAEKIFWRLRQNLLSLTGVHSAWQSHQLFTLVGDLPTYHPQDSEPVFGETIPRNFEDFLGLQTSKGLVRDFTTLLQDCARVETFKLPHEVAKETLVEGFSELKKILV